jgi:lysine biosynthesis protein LysW
MTTGFCPDRDESIELGNQVKKGQTATCESCGAYLEVVSTNPIELDWAYDDYDDDDDEVEYDDDF